MASKVAYTLPSPIRAAASVLSMRDVMRLTTIRIRLICIEISCGDIFSSHRSIR